MAASSSASSGDHAGGADELEEGGLSSRLVLQVHDEVLVEVAVGEHDAATARTQDALSGAAELKVPLEVNLAFGPTWADAKG